MFVQLAEALMETPCDVSLLEEKVTDLENKIDKLENSIKELEHLVHLGDIDII